MAFASTAIFVYFKWRIWKKKTKTNKKWAMVRQRVSVGCYQYNDSIVSMLYGSSSPENDSHFAEWLFCSFQSHNYSKHIQKARRWLVSFDEMWNYLFTFRAHWTADVDVDADGVDVDVLWFLFLLCFFSHSFTIFHCHPNKFHVQLSAFRKPVQTERFSIKTCRYYTLVSIPRADFSLASANTKSKYFFQRPAQHGTHTYTQYTKTK